eukprot:1268060-Pyramimonas_sp.AAC.1
MEGVAPRTPGSMLSGGTHPWDAAIDQDLEGPDAHGDARGQPVSTPAAWSYGSRSLPEWPRQW